MPLFFFGRSFVNAWPSEPWGLVARGAPAAFALVLAVGVGALPAQAQTAADQLAAYVAQSGQAPQTAQGQEFFTNKHGHDGACASCHTAKPTVDGKHASTGKPIRPLAPAANPERFVDPAKTEKWFRRNCNDVVGRECSVAEKADVLAWLITLKP
jgi:hypothetical protein